MGVFTQKSVFKGHITVVRKNRTVVFLCLVESKRGTVATISKKDNRVRYKQESAELCDDTAIILSSHKKSVNYKGRMIYYADEKAMYWILDEFDKEQDIIPSEMEMKGKCYWSIIMATI